MFSLKINKIHEFYMITTPKNIFPEFWGHVSPTSTVSYAYGTNFNFYYMDDIQAMCSSDDPVRVDDGTSTIMISELLYAALPRP